MSNERTDVRIAKALSSIKEHQEDIKDARQMIADRQRSIQLWMAELPFVASAVIKYGTGKHERREEWRLLEPTPWPRPEGWPRDIERLPDYLHRDLPDGAWKLRDIPGYGVVQELLARVKAKYPEPQGIDSAPKGPGVRILGWEPGIGWVAMERTQSTPEAWFGHGKEWHPVVWLPIPQDAGTVVR